MPGGGDSQVQRAAQRLMLQGEGGGDSLAVASLPTNEKGAARTNERAGQAGGRSLGQEDNQLAAE